MTDVAEPPHKPSAALAGVAAAMPTLFTMVSCGSFTLSSQGGPTRAIEEMGLAFWGVMLAIALAWCVTSVLLFLAGRGMRVPAAITVFAAALPWIAGVVGVRMGIGAVADALEYVDGSTRAAITAQGISEATNARLFGATMASGFLAAVAFGLALAALGQRAPRRSFAAAGLGLVVSIPLFGLAGIGAFGSELGVTMGSALLTLAGVGAVIAVTLAGAGAGADEPHGRSGALAASAPIAAGLAVLAATAAAMSGAIIAVFGAIANADPSSRGVLIGHAAMELSPLSWTMKLALPATLIAAAALAGWAAIRARPSIGRFAGGATLAICAVSVVLLDLSAMSYAASTLEDGARVEWQQLDGFEAVALPDVERAGEVDAIVTTSGLSTTEGASLAGFDEVAMASALARLRDAPDREGPGDVPDWLREGPDDEDEEPRPLSAAPELVLAIDRRVSAPQLRVLLSAANAAGIRALAFAGDLADAPTLEQEEAVRETLPMLALVLGGQGSVRVVLEGALPEGMADRDRTLHHVMVSGAIPTTTRTRPSAEESGREITEPEYRRYAAPLDALYLAFSDEASVESVLVTAAHATESGLRPILVRGEIPGNPTAAYVEPAQDGLDRTGFGFGSTGDSLGPPGTLGRGAEPGSVGSGDAVVRGSLSRDVIRRVIRQHLGEIRFCYERGLSSRPGMSGRVMVSFIISPTGSVQTATVSSTTLENAEVEACITTAVRRWRFPPPDGGGVVGVNYPFVLTPAE